jgi:hypothetical protein
VDARAQVFVGHRGETAQHGADRVANAELFLERGSQDVHVGRLDSNATADGTCKERSEDEF